MRSLHHLALLFKDTCIGKRQGQVSCRVRDGSPEKDPEALVVPSSRGVQTPLGQRPAEEADAQGHIGRTLPRSAEFHLADAGKQQGSPRSVANCYRGFCRPRAWSFAQGGSLSRANGFRLLGRVIIGDAGDRGLVEYSNIPVARSQTDLPPILGYDGTVHALPVLEKNAVRSDLESGHEARGERQPTEAPEQGPDPGYAAPAIRPEAACFDFHHLVNRKSRPMLITFSRRFILFAKSAAGCPAGRMDGVSGSRRLTDGDEDSYRKLEDLYHRFQRDIFYYLYRSMRDEGAALDLVQDTFVRFITSYRTRADLLADEGQCKKLLFRIAKNAMINHLQAASVRRVTVTADIEVQDFRSAEHVALLDMEAADLQDLMDGGLADLSETHREVLLLTYDQQLSGRDVAQLLGITSGAVSRRLDTARRALRRALVRRGINVDDFGVR